MNYYCGNCGWSEIVGSQIMCNYSSHRTWRDGCCEAWKPKTTDENDMVKVVRCKDCKECYFASNRIQSEQTFACGKYGIDVTPDWFCADGERQEGR